MISKSNANGIEIITLDSGTLRCSLAPALGGKITSLYNKQLDKEFLWTNEKLLPEMHAPGADYDSHFFGGIDELLPNDLPETIDSIPYPDHGELWTTSLQYHIAGDKLTVFGKLKQSGLSYSKTLYVANNTPVVYLDYRIKNETDTQRHFLWKLHAALRIQPGDRLVTSAPYGQVAHPDYSRFKTLEPFAWPLIEGTDASVVPPPNGTTDFFYLYPAPSGEIQLRSGEDCLFSYRYDAKVFPFQWYFASYGGFFDHYTAILEPCTNMPMSVNDAIAQGQCATLQPGEELTTTVRIFAGKKDFFE